LLFGSYVFYFWSAYGDSVFVPRVFAQEWKNHEGEGEGAGLRKAQVLD